MPSNGEARKLKIIFIFFPWPTVLYLATYIATNGP